MPDIFYSKKFQMAVAGVIVVIVTSFIPEVDDAELTKIVGLVMSYIVGQGLADWGKEKAKVESVIRAMEQEQEAKD